MAGALVGSHVLPLQADVFEAGLRQSLPVDKLDLNLQAARRGMKEAQRLAAAA